MSNLQRIAVFVSMLLSFAVARTATAQVAPLAAGAGSAGAAALAETKAPPAIHVDDQVDPDVQLVLNGAIPTNKELLEEEIRKAVDNRAKFDVLVAQSEERKEKGPDPEIQLKEMESKLRELPGKKSSLEDLLNKIEKVSCAGGNLQPTQDLTDELVRALSSADLWSAAPWLTMEWSSAMGELKRIKQEKEATCQKLVDKVRNSHTAILAPFGALEEFYRNEQKNLKGIIGKQDKPRRLRDAWNNRFAELIEAQRKLQGDVSAATDVSTKLPYLIGILGVFSLSIMVMVRRFPTDVQREWVRTGQVIQFLTVTIIIIVILALGLAGKLTQESLGTLLGAIGGYVLAQGVGRGRRAPPPPAGATTIATTTTTQAATSPPQIRASTTTPQSL
ncbi:hypothetical protein [Sorangium sp. So ce131]|uniref:hypothetical protein n=1 Tax=Sorangium sp. So ce131 TaxID=3133282 RepID=UPI003F600466